MNIERPPPDCSRRDQLKEARRAGYQAAMGVYTGDGNTSSWEYPEEYALDDELIEAWKAGYFEMMEDS
jgi:hypothetical protein